MIFGCFFLCSKHNRISLFTVANETNFVYLVCVRYFFQFLKHHRQSSINNTCYINEYGSMGNSKQLILHILRFFLKKIKLTRSFYRKSAKIKSFQKIQKMSRIKKDYHRLGFFFIFRGFVKLFFYIEKIRRRKYGLFWI